MSVQEARGKAIGEALDDIRAIEAQNGVNRDSLELIKQRMIKLGQQRDLFPDADFPLAPEHNGEFFDVLSVDDDGRFELYIEVADQTVDVPPHDHTTWAVVVGIEGDELNRLYDADPNGGTPPTLREEVHVGPGTGVAMMPEDFHSIHMAEGERNMHLHLYGLCFAKLKDRTLYDKEAGAYRQFDVALD